MNDCLMHQGSVAVGVVLRCLLALSLVRGVRYRTNAFAQKILVTNRTEPRARRDHRRHLVNPWGIALRPPGAGGHIWVSNAGNLSTSTYIGDVNGAPLHQDGLKIVYLDEPVDFL